MGNALQNVENNQRRGVVMLKDFNRFIHFNNKNG